MSIVFSEYLSPLLRQLQKIHLNITVRSQKMYMTPLSGIKPQWLQQEQLYALPYTHLPLAINAIEAKLGKLTNISIALHNSALYTYN